MGLDLGTSTCAPCPARFPRAGGSDPGLGAGSVNPPCLAPRALAALCSFPTLPALAGGDPPSQGVKPLCVSPPILPPPQEPALLAQRPGLGCSHFPALNYPRPCHSAATNYFKREGLLLDLAPLSQGCQCWG